MKTIVIKTQKELDALPDIFSKYTRVEIRSETKIYVKKAMDNSSVVARGHSFVVAMDNSSVVAMDNSSVVAMDNSSVVAMDNSSVVAMNNSSVVARGHSSVEAWGHSSVLAMDNSSVEALGHSSVLAMDNSSVVARGHSSVVAMDNSFVVAWGHSSVELFLYSYVLVLSCAVVIKKLLDHSTAVFKGCRIQINEKSDTAHAREIPSDIEVSFEEWLRRGYVVADGIHKKLVSQKQINNIKVYKVSDFPKKTTSYVVERDGLFSHGETVEKAIEDLRYKVGDRDTTEFKHWRDNLDKEITIEDAIAGYRVITGACESRVKEFVKSIQVPDKLTPNIVMELTKDAYGNKQFRQFLSKRGEDE